MAFVTGYQFDVFISYAQADNGSDASGRQWVSRFVEYLQTALRQRLGGTDDLRVFFDASSFQANHQLDDLLVAARNSATFLAIASRSYAAREWTKRELQSFTEAVDDKRRFFAIECMPLDFGETYPEPLQSQKRLAFWRVPGVESSTPLPLSPHFDGEAFHQRVHDLAEQIRAQLLTLRKVSEASDAAPSRPAPARQAARTPEHAKTVLLAQVTDDLEPMREELRRYLEQFGIPILANENWPQGGEPFREAVAQDLAAAGLLVQLLGPRGGRQPPDLPEGYTAHQHNAAQAMGVPLLQWRRPDLDPQAVPDDAYRALLSGERVMADGFESFKAEVLRQATLPPPQPATAHADGNSLVFINAAQDDMPIARALRSEIPRTRFSVAIPAPGGSSEEIRLDLEENLIDCGVLILVYGKAEPTWVRGQLRLFNKLRNRRSQPPRLLAIYTGPPPEKFELGFDMPEVVEVDSRAGVSLGPLRDVAPGLFDA